MGYDTIYVKTLEKMSNSTKDEIMAMIDGPVDIFIKNGLLKIPDRLVEKALVFIEKVFRICYSNIGTLDSKMSTYCRSVIANRYGKDSPLHIIAKDIVKISYEEKGSLLKKQRESLLDKNKNVPTFSEEDVLKIINLIDSDNKYQKMIALLLASGSRPSEIIHFSDYEKLSDNYVVQKGITKSKSLKELVKPIIYISVDKFIDEVSNLRDMMPDKVKNDHNEGAHPTITNGCIREIRKIIGNYGCSTLREMYAYFSYSKFKDDRSVFKEKMSQLLWSNKVLGHSAGDFSITVHYNTMDINLGSSLHPKKLTVEEIFNKCSSQEKFWIMCNENGHNIPRLKARQIYKEFSLNQIPLSSST